MAGLQVTYIVDPTSECCDHGLVGGKARNLWLLGKKVECQVPPWFCITTQAFDFFVEVKASSHEPYCTLVPRTFYIGPAVVTCCSVGRPGNKARFTSLLPTTYPGEQPARFASY